LVEKVDKFVENRMPQRNGWQIFEKAFGATEQKSWESRS
jgi:hypothetical protein